MMGDGDVRPGRSTDPRAPVQSVNYYNQVFGLSNEGHIVSFSRVTRSWTRFEPEEKTPRLAVDISCDGVLWMIDAQHHVYRKTDARNTGEWQLVSRGAVTDVSVGIGDRAWAVAMDGQASQYVEATGEFQRSDAVLSNVAVGCDGAVWGVTRNSNLWKLLEDGKWAEEAQGVKAVDVSHDMYVIDAKGSLFAYRPPAAGKAASAADWVDMKTKAVSVSGGPDGTLWVVDDKGAAFRHHGQDVEKALSRRARLELEAKQGGTWVDVPGSGDIMAIASGMKGELYGITQSPEFQLRRFNEDKPDEWDVVPSPKLRSLDVGCDGLSIWGIGVDDHVHHYAGNGEWMSSDEPLVAVTVGKDEDDVFGLRRTRAADGTAKLELTRKVAGGAEASSGAAPTASVTWKVQRNGGDLVFLDQVAAGCDGTVWGVDDAGHLFSRNDATDSSFKPRGDDVYNVAVGDKVFLLDNNRFLFEYRSPKINDVEPSEGKHNWKLMHKRLQSVAAGIDSLYGIDMLGKVVRFQADTPAPVDPNAWVAVREASVAAVRQLAVGSANDVYALDRHNVLLRQIADDTFHAVGENLVFANISCGCDGALWAVAKNGTVYAMEEMALGLSKVNLTTIASAASAASATVRAVAVGSRSLVWVVDGDGQPFQYNRTARTFKAMPEAPDRLRQISATCKGDLWAVSEQNIVYHFVDGRWFYAAFGARQIEAGRHIYLVSKKKKLFRLYQAQEGKKWVHIGPVEAVAAAADGSVWGIEEDKDVFVIHKPSTDAIVPPRPDLTTDAKPVQKNYAKRDVDGRGPSSVTPTGDKARPALVDHADSDDLNAIFRWHDEAKKHLEEHPPATSFKEAAQGQTRFNVIDEDIIKQRAATQMPEK